MKQILTLLSIAVLAVSCATKVAEPVTVNGMVIDASMNGVCVVTATNDTVFVSTLDTDPMLVSGVLIEDSISLIYKDTLIDEIPVKQVIKAEILRHSPYFFIQGSWIEPNPIKESEVQGFTLNQNGTVAMINIATLNYTSWNLSPCCKSLTLSGQSIGNKETIEVNDTYAIDKLDADSLVLSNAGVVAFRLARQK